MAEVLKDAMDPNQEMSATKEEIKNRAEQSLNKYKLEALEEPFKGVYYGQAALPVKPDTLYYLNNEVLQQCRVTSYDTGKPREAVIYNMEKAKGKDPYEIFLSGTSALQVIENPMATKEKELIVFRDSFGSSFVPLLLEAYQEVVLIDTRYISSTLLGDYVDFADADVLFLYNLLLNYIKIFFLLLLY